MKQSFGKTTPNEAPAKFPGFIIGRKKLCEYIGYSDTWLRRLMGHKGFPKPIAYANAPGPKPVWAKDEVDAWLKQNGETA